MNKLIRDMFYPENVKEPGNNKLIDALMSRDPIDRIIAGQFVIDFMPVVDAV
jgi:hypothetical protein